MDYFADCHAHILVKQLSFLVLDDVVAIPVELFVTELVSTFFVDHSDCFLQQIPALCYRLLCHPTAGKFIDLERHFFFQII